MKIRTNVRRVCIRALSTGLIAALDDNHQVSRSRNSATEVHLAGFSRPWLLLQHFSTSPCGLVNAGSSRQVEVRLKPAAGKKRSKGWLTANHQLKLAARADPLKPVWGFKQDLND